MVYIQGNHWICHNRQEGQTIRKILINSWSEDSLNFPNSNNVLSLQQNFVVWKFRIERCPSTVDFYEKNTSFVIKK